MDYVKVGKITHYFDHIGVAVLKVTSGSVKVGDKIRIGEFGEGFEQTVDSMQQEHEQVEEAVLGNEVGLKVVKAAHENDFVYLIQN